MAKNKKKSKSEEIEKNFDWEANDDCTNVEFVVENVRLAFSGNGKTLFEPEEFKKSVRYKADFILEDDDTRDQLLEIVQFLVRENVDGQEDLTLDMDSFDGDIEGLSSLFLKIGDENTNKEGEPYDGFAGNLYIGGKRAEKLGRPTVFADTQEEIEDANDKRIMKDGCYVNLAARAYYSTEWEMIGCTIEAVLFTDEGESFSVDNSYGGNESKKNKLMGSHKPKKSKASKAFDKKKKKSK